MMNKNNLNREKIARHITDVMLEKQPKDENEFQEWVVSNEYASEIMKELSDSEKLEKKLSNFQCKEKEKDRLLLITKITRIQKRRRLILSTASVAAAVLFLTMIVWHESTPEKESIIGNVKSSIPETPKLILSGGNTILLGEVSDTLTIDGILKSEDIVKITPEISGDGMEQLIVPSMCTYTLMLSDGTKVTLNSNSKLSFPQTFAGKTREVELTGEGYFEVSKESDRSFIVKSGDYKVEVHGTKFNINCYDNSMKTFLLEGSVSVRSNNVTKKQLRPMQLATIDGNELKIENVTKSDTYLSWLSNNFIFDALPLDSVVDILERWYGVDFNRSFEMGKPVFITGMFERNIDLAELIKLIEKIAEIEIVNKEGIYHIKSKNM